MEGRCEGGGVREGVMRRGSGEEREWWRVRGVGGVGSDDVVLYSELLRVRD